MAILKREDFFSRLESRLSDDKSDDAISFLEDMTDTYNDLENKANSSSNEEWEKKYNELDEMWKTRYRHRFFSGDNRKIPTSSDDEFEEDDYKPSNMTIDKLFKNERR